MYQQQEGQADRPLDILNAQGQAQGVEWLLAQVEIARPQPPLDPAPDDRAATQPAIGIGTALAGLRSGGRPLATGRRPAGQPGLAGDPGARV
ncbi:hypothetical protein [Candidatus Amarolinea dominans]|uniref:hypothetical protein n=1 Tax=Candidatus Amarolinea dominans TaxID=3140696 RepID=UPI001D308E20|nr:hypothetical protein [Anaerolineae bacterium]